MRLRKRLRDLTVLSTVAAPQVSRWLEESEQMRFARTRTGTEEQANKRNKCDTNGNEI
jgi:hypothetical protein